MENKILEKFLKVKSSTISDMKNLLEDVKSCKNEKLEQEVEKLKKELQEVKKLKKYWLVWEEKVEKFDKETVWKLPVLKEIKKYDIKNNDSENNILIQWDNYHTLSVLNYTHKGKIDVIYIDPPYNTGNNDFIYNDRIVDKEDKFRHSKWLSFMSKRLKLAKNLLSEKGSIFISIDDNEIGQLKLLCDEIFWENNLLKNIVWESWKPFWFKATKTTWPRIHEYILHYSKNINKVWYNPTYSEMFSSKWQPILTGSLIKVETDKIYSMDFIQGAKESVVKYWLNSFWSWQKPIKLIKKFLLAWWNKDSTILDFFAGSGTTGHAVMGLNKEDWGNRKFILATNNENNICEEVTYERVKRVMNWYENLKGEKVEWLGGNLKYLKTDFIDKHNSNDDLRKRMVDRCSELLCLKENIWDAVTLSPTKERAGVRSKIKIFERKDKYLAILYDMFYLSEFIENLNNLDENKKVSIYAFSHYKIDEEDFENLKMNFEIEEIPDPILEVYDTIFGL